MVVQAETVPRALDAGDSAGAATALAAIEETGRDALTEMRRLLGVLRRDGDGAELAPQPGLARVLALVERIRERGLEVELRSRARRPAAPLSARRRPHRATGWSRTRSRPRASRARPRPSVLIRYTADELRAPGQRRPRGRRRPTRLPGLRDRVGLYGGHLQRRAASTSGGFRLSARLPLEEVALMRRRLRGLSERDWRVIDRLFVAFLIALSR